MGLTFVNGTVRGAKGPSRKVKFLVDSGATYTLLLFEFCNGLKLNPKRTLGFTLADGKTIRRNVSECFLSIPQGEGHTPVILGEPGDDALLGAVTLEELGLVLDPFQRRLRAMEFRLA